MKQQGKRIKILDENEIRELYDLPCFDHDEREIYFSIEPNEKTELDNLRTIPSKVYFIFKTEIEQQIWSECTRLVANSIIFYNAFIVSRLLEQKESLKLFEEASIIKRISPVAWRHINLYGQFKFHGKSSRINIDKIIKSLEKTAIGSIVFDQAHLPI